MAAPTDERQVAIDRVLELDPNNAHFWLGRLLYDRNNYAGAEREYRGRPSDRTRTPRWRTRA